MDPSRVRSSSLTTLRSRRRLGGIIPNSVSQPAGTRSDGSGSRADKRRQPGGCADGRHGPGWTGSRISNASTRSGLTHTSRDRVSRLPTATRPCRDTDQPRQGIHDRGGPPSEPPRSAQHRPWLPTPRMGPCTCGHQSARCSAATDPEYRPAISNACDPDMRVPRSRTTSAARAFASPRSNSVVARSERIRVTQGRCQLRLPTGTAEHFDDPWYRRRSRARSRRRPSASSARCATRPRACIRVDRPSPARSFVPLRARHARR